MHKFSFWDPKVNLPGPSSHPDDPKSPLKYLYVCSVGAGRHREAEVVHVEKGNAFGEVDVEGGNVYYEE